MLKRPEGIALNQPKGNVFDIRRFSTHDGDGIRTTIFLKGCPLRCVWCQNPEGIDVRRHVVYFDTRCIGCLSCVHQCQNGAVSLEDGKITLHRDIPNDWDATIDTCPTGALAYDCRQMTVEQAVNELKRDLPFFRHGGGVTLSGGEPFSQQDFALELLKALEKEGIHTAVESALCIPSSVLLQALPFIDTLFADCKVLDPELHRRFTGVDNSLIRRNLSLVLQSAYRDRVVVRTPLIPEYTATIENVEAIGRFLSGLYPDVTYELLNYNPLAEAKYKHVDWDYCFTQNPHKFSPQQMQDFAAAARRGGVQNVLIES